MLLLTELIQVSLGSRKSLSKTPSNKDWEDLFEMSVRQAVAGVVFEALDNLATNGNPPYERKVISI